MNYSKLILVGCISAFVAFLTSVLGVAGTIIGSVISSVLYNMLSEALEAPVQEATFSKDFEWEVAYVFPLIVIILIEILFICSLLSELGVLPYTFLKAYISLQGVAGNNLFRILGVGLLIISIYPFVLKPNFIKKAHGAIIAFIGLVFLARGFIDYGNTVTNLYDDIFINFDLPIAIIAVVLLLFVVIRILISAKESEMEFEELKRNINKDNSVKTVKRVHKSQSNSNYKNQNPQNRNVNVKDYPRNNSRRKANDYKKSQNNPDEPDVKFSNRVDNISNSGINESSENIHFESNNLLDDYKK